MQGAMRMHVDRRGKQKCYSADRLAALSKDVMSLWPATLERKQKLMEIAAEFRQKMWEDIGNPRRQDFNGGRYLEGNKASAECILVRDQTEEDDAANDVVQGTAFEPRSSEI